MKIAIECPQCQRCYQLAPEMVGKRVKCAGCATTFVAQPLADKPVIYPAAVIAAVPAPRAAPTVRPTPAANPAPVARPAPAVTAARSRPPQVQAPVRSSLDDLLGDEFGAGSNGASAPGFGNTLAGDPALYSGGPRFGAAPRKGMSSEKRLVLIAGGVAAAIAVLGVGVGLSFALKSSDNAAAPQVQPTTAKFSEPAPPAGASPPVAQGPPQAQAPPQNPPATADVPPGSVPFSRPAPDSGPNHPSDYEKNVREALALMRLIADQMASIHDRASAQAVAPQVIDNDNKLVELVRKIQYTETRRAQTPHDVEVVQQLLPEIEAQASRVQSERTRLALLGGQLQMQDTMDRLSNAGQFSRPAPPGAQPSPAAPGVGPRSHLPHGPHGPRHLPHRPGMN